ncbi:MULTISPECIES: extracellular solute-binding protein [unclassified Sinorhizobium]|uniref:extracellular solute-binding protein n=1 Tax=unclassified Sinorhizobium TaxID=2613772 RepID=UPI0035257FF1
MNTVKVCRVGQFCAAAIGAAAFFSSMTPASAETVIRWLHIESVPSIVSTWRGIADAFEKQHPGVKVELQFLENQAFKAKLPTLLQSNEPPSVFYTWSGGVLKAQADTGMLRDIKPALDANGGAWRNQLSPAAVEGMTFDGKTWGAPYKTGLVSFFYNKALFKQAGIDASTIKTWDDFLGAVKTLKAAGITPIAGGGGDKWPIHFYWGYLAMREAGQKGFEAAKAGEGDGFAGEPFIKAGEHLVELGKLEPFQKGYLGATWNDALATFGDGRAAMLLGFENTNLTQSAGATDGKGQPDDNIGRFPFPTVSDGPGLVTDNLGRLNGWVITINAPPETEEFLKFLSDTDNQRLLAEKTSMLPIAKGANDGVKNPLLKDSADALDKETWHQNFLDQDLGPNVGAVVNDMTMEIVAGQISPADAAQQIQDAYSLEAK